MLATWSPNLLFLIVFLTSVNTGTSLSLSPQEHLLLLVQCLLPRCWPPSHPRPPSSSSFSELNGKNTTVSSEPLLELQTRYFCCDFFLMPLPKRWAAILGNWTRHQLGGFISNLKPISSCVGVQISEALTPTPNLHGKCTVTPTFIPNCPCLWCEMFPSSPWAPHPSANQPPASNKRPHQGLLSVIPASIPHCP